MVVINEDSNSGMRASSEQHYVEEGEGAALEIHQDQDELAEEEAAVPSSQGKKVCQEAEVVGSVRPRLQTSGKWS